MRLNNVQFENKEHKEYYLFRWKHRSDMFFSTGPCKKREMMSQHNSFNSETEMIKFLPTLRPMYLNDTTETNFLNIIVVRCTFVTVVRRTLIDYKMEIIEELPIYWYLSNKSVKV